MLETLTQLCIDYGYWGLVLSAFVAGSILPFSSEAVMVILIGMGLDPVWCVAAATFGNTLGGMTCYGIGMLGRAEWIARLGIDEGRIGRAKRFLAGRGAVMAFFAFLPTIGEAIALVLGLMRSNIWWTSAAMTAGKAARYTLVVLSYQGIVSLF